MNDRALRQILRICAIVAGMGGVIGLFRENHTLLGGFLLSLMGLYFLKNIRRQPDQNRALLLTGIGMGLTLVCGTVVEVWGTHSGHWTYRDVPEGVMVPLWVPVAWAWAYKVVYKAEEILIRRYPIGGVRKGVLLILLPSVAIPTLGELVAINLGTWDYHWQPQLWGMPPLAVMLLGVFHLFVFGVMKIVCGRLRVDDVVYAEPAAKSKKCAI